MQRLLPSLFLGGYECSTHCLHTGRRLDLIASTHHDRYVTEDYLRLRQAGMRAARDGTRWHLIEAVPGQYRFESLLPMLRAAQRTGTTVIWDLLHFGWPADLDIFKPAFVDRFARYARQVARVLSQESDEVPFVSLVNEISFVSWGGGEVGYLNPFQRGRERSLQLKQQLVRATVAACEAVWDVIPSARLVHCDPAIHIAADVARPQDQPVAEGYRQSMFQAWDMIAGYQNPELGGQPRYLDVIGVNYYFNNQWVHCGPTLKRTDALYRPFAEILKEIQDRYHRPVFISETGIEAEERPEWLAYIGDEAEAAMQAGVRLEGICLYPILNHLGWDDDRMCPNGLWECECTAEGYRNVYEPLAVELQRQMARLTPLWRAQPPSYAPAAAETAQIA